MIHRSRKPALSEILLEPPPGEALVRLSFAIRSEGRQRGEKEPVAGESGGFAETRLRFFP